MYGVRGTSVRPSISIWWHTNMCFESGCTHRHRGLRLQCVFPGDTLDLWTPCRKITYAFYSLNPCGSHWTPHPAPATLWVTGMVLSHDGRWWKGRYVTSKGWGLVEGVVPWRHIQRGTLRHSLSFFYFLVVMGRVVCSITCYQPDILPYHRPKRNNFN